MTHRLKQVVFKTVCEAVSNIKNIGALNLGNINLTIREPLQDKLHCSVSLVQCRDNYNAYMKEIAQNEDKLIELGKSKSINFKNINLRDGIEFDISLKDYTKDVLNSNPIELSSTPKKEKVLVEFSSPNIAKEFHIGHLRSTIIGNTLSNIFKKLGKEVVKVNYLGDWGTQFGLLKLGVNRLGFTEEVLRTDPISKLHAAYVHANKIALGDSHVNEEAKEIFQRLESGDEEITKAWGQYREWTVSELSGLYKRIGIEFDVYEWESMYDRSHSSKLVAELEERNIIKTDDVGRKVVDVDGKNIILIKSDGSTLYLMRDVAAFFHRRSHYGVDKMYYVVEGHQGKHFTNLSSVCEVIEPNSTSILKHVMFGRINGMSTRKNSRVLLRDLLDTMQEKIFNNMKVIAKPKIPPNKEVADILAVTALVFYDLKRSISRDYNFDWDEALSITGMSGPQVQFVHCRICSVLKREGHAPAAECDPDALLEPEAIDLVLHLAKFEEILLLAEERLDPNFLIAYLFSFTKALNKALKALIVRGREDHLRGQRLLLFHSCKLVIAESLRILGLTVLEEM